MYGRGMCDLRPKITKRKPIFISDRLICDRNALVWFYLRLSQALSAIPMRKILEISQLTHDRRSVPRFRHSEIVNDILLENISIYSYR